MPNEFKFFDYIKSFRLISYNEMIDVDYLKSTLIISEDSLHPGKYNLIAKCNNESFILITVSDKNFLIDLLKEIRSKASILSGEYDNGIKEFYIKDNVNKLSKIDKWAGKQIVITS